MFRLSASVLIGAIPLLFYNNTVIYSVNNTTYIGN